MGNFRSLRYLVLIIFMMIILMACQGGDEDAEEVNVRVEASLTMQALGTNVAATLEAQELASMPSPTETPTPTNTPASSPTMTLTPTVEHVMVPNDPQGPQSSLTDISTAPLAEEGTSIGDSYVINLYERPFTAEQMVYKGYLDIVYTHLNVDSTWIYAIIYLEEELPESAAANYGIEFDLDRDGRGDWLVLAALPSSSEWTTDGVGVYKDADGDVGAATPLRSDAPVPSQNGYEEEVFWAGRGTDPDTAWTRRDPDEPKRVQIALKHNLFDTSHGFLWGTWANEGNENPAWFDYNDHFTLEEAGSPVMENSDYPLKALALTDNTCRSWFGFDPVGNEPGMCEMDVPEQEGGPNSGMDVPEQEGGPNIGWCIKAITHVGCTSPCYEECPKGRICMPCQLP